MAESELAGLLVKHPSLAKKFEEFHQELVRVEGNEKLANDIIASLVALHSERPIGWSSTSSATYYNAKFAKFVKQKYASLVPEGDLLIKVNELGRITRKTLKVALYQGLKFIVEKDPEDSEREKYRELKDQTEFRIHADGILLCWKSIARLKTTETVIPFKRDANKWKQELDDFLNMAGDGQKIVLDDLRLSEQELRDVRELISIVPGMFIKDLSISRIEILKNVKLWEKYMKPE